MRSWRDCWRLLALCIPRFSRSEWRYILIGHWRQIWRFTFVVLFDRIFYDLTAVSYALTCDTITTVACSGLVCSEVRNCIRNDMRIQVCSVTQVHLKRDQHAAGFKKRMQNVKAIVSQVLFVRYHRCKPTQLSLKSGRRQKGCYEKTTFMTLCRCQTLKAACATTSVAAAVG